MLALLTNLERVGDGSGQVRNRDNQEKALNLQGLSALNQSRYLKFSMEIGVSQGNQEAEMAFWILVN